MSEKFATTFADLRRGMPLRPFKPGCMYIKELDWLIYLACDCSYTAVPTEEPQIEYLINGGEVVGIKILGFSQLPRAIRQQLLESTTVDPDDIRGIEALRIQNLKEQDAEISAVQAAFFEELRRRANR